MKTLVTGATGFLGQFLCKKLESQGDEVTPVNSKNCDLTQEASLHQFDSTHFDRIFHLAAWTQAGDFCLKHPGEQWIINQKLNTHMLSWWAEKQPQAKLICMGTSCSYDPTLPLTEENYLSGKPIDSLFTYAMTKRMLYAGLTAIHKQFGLDYLYLVPSTLYGPGYHTDGRQMHFIFDLIRKINRGKLYDEPVVLWGDGEQKRELVHVQDFVEVMLQLTEKASNTLINIGAGEEYSIKTFAQTICSHTGYPFEKVQYDLTKYVGAKSKCLDTEKFRRLLPDFVPTPLDQGLQETTEWFRSTFHKKETAVL
ncbi:MAG: dTDP-4-oxo-6-deoxy-D-allose reductase [Chlamydiae bacterium]|nr:dTDP-4-oxo-6-deoxy-D-allose reductase [Chlamydiota bacterium]